MNAKTFLVISLLLNLGLAAALLRPTAPAPAAPPPAAPAVTPAPTVAAPAARPRTVTQIVTNTLSQKFDWNAVESDDYKKYIANLRAIGCPEETIRDIITADVNKL